MKNDRIKQLQKELQSRPISRVLETKAVIAEETVFMYNGKELAILQWTCDPKYINKLCWASGEPLTAIEIQYKYENISWSAGQGWPTYHVPCPRGDSRHRIQWEFGGIVTSSCTMEGHARGNRVTEVDVYVTDDQYWDNTGTFVVQIIAYSQT